MLMISKICQLRIPILLVLVMATPASLAQSGPGGAWLDADNHWNTAGAPVPVPPEQKGGNLENCQISVRPAALPEDRLIEAAGWTLTGAARIYGATTVILGMANADGMCRPLMYQVFVFTGGVFSGTLSPLPMDSRTDGSLSRVELARDGFIYATFNRYKPNDALCCASGQSRVFYTVDTGGGAPLLAAGLPADTETLPAPE